MGSTENCSVCDAVRSVPGRSPFLVPQKLTRSPDQTPTRSRRSEWAGRKARCCRAGFPCRQAPPCVGADARIGPPSALAVGCLFRIAAHSQPQCRAGLHTRRLRFPAPQGLPGEMPAWLRHVPIVTRSPPPRFPSKKSPLYLCNPPIFALPPFFAVRTIDFFRLIYYSI